MALPAGPKNRDVQHAAIPRDLDPLAFAAWWGGKPYTWQIPIIERYCAQQRPGVAYVQVPRKNGKSFAAACVAIDEMVRMGGQVFLIADSERNLKSALFFELCRQVRESPQLSACVLTYKDHLECPGSGGGIYLRPNNLSASQSINPDLVVFDEVHMQKTDSIWHGMMLAGDAASRPLLFGITTPGYEQVSLAHDLYQGVKAGTIDGFIHEAADPACPLDVDGPILEANPILEDRPELLERFRYDPAKISEHDHRRFRLGQWTTTARGWLPYGALAALQKPSDYAQGQRLWVGFDGSYSGDSTALVGCNAEGHVKVLGCWENPGRRGWRVPREEVKARVLQVMADYDATLYPDPPYWAAEIAEWDSMWPGRVIEFPTFSPARMAPACSSFEHAVLDSRITHDGDRRLLGHVANCVIKDTPGGVVITKADKDSPAKIDLAVAAVIAVHHAIQESAVAVPDLFVL